MFIYGLYAIESHKCDIDQQRDVPEDIGLNFQRQKSYSICCSSGRNEMQLNNTSKLKLGFLNYNKIKFNNDRNGVTKYEKNLDTFEYYIETLNKIAEQSRLEKVSKLATILENNENQDLFKKRRNSFGFEDFWPDTKRNDTIGKKRNACFQTTPVRKENISKETDNKHPRGNSKKWLIKILDRFKRSNSIV